MGFNYIRNLFKNHNVCVCGTKGTGKDLLFGNVIARSKKPYVSNLCYGYDFIPLNFDEILMNGNTYDNLIKGDVIYYESPYPIGTDIYVSDCGIYLPSQYCNELNKKYSGMALFQALSRQLSNSRFHVNAQQLSRVYDKIREQSDIYIYCKKVIYIPKVDIVIQFVNIYDKYESACGRVNPCRVHEPLFNREAKMQAKIYRDNFYNVHGDVRSMVLIYRNKSKHDTNHFREVFKNGKKEK